MTKRTLLHMTPAQAGKRLRLDLDLLAKQSAEAGQRLAAEGWTFRHHATGHRDGVEVSSFNLPHPRDVALSEEGPSAATVSARVVWCPFVTYGYGFEYTVENDPGIWRLMDRIRVHDDIAIPVQVPLPRTLDIAAIRLILRLAGYRSKSMRIADARALERRLRPFRVSWRLRARIAVDRTHRTIYYRGDANVALETIALQAVRQGNPTSGGGPP